MKSNSCPIDFIKQDEATFNENVKVLDYLQEILLMHGCIFGFLKLFHVAYLHKNINSRK